MATSKRSGSLSKSRHEIAGKVRDLRVARGWTQAELAKHLELSQNRLSEIERGDGSFTAEQLLLVLRLFNVAATDFVDEPRERDLEIQNALARLGASHLHETTRQLPSDQLADVHDVIREALLLGTPRLVTAIAPVLIAQGQRLNVERLHAELAKLGRERRLMWVIDNTLIALGLLKGSEWTRLRKRVDMNIVMFLDLARTGRRKGAPIDVLDPTIRSRKTLEEVQLHASKPSLDWGIATSLQPDDFVEALKASRAAG